MVQSLDHIQTALTGLVIPVAIPVGVRPMVTLVQFSEIVAVNPELRLELTATGELIVMAPAGSESGNRNLSLSGQLYIWTAQHEDLGHGFDSSAGFRLPSGAVRSPDAAWVERWRWQALTAQERQGFAPLCPDFVAELRSETDSLSVLQTKMQEYLQNGAKLGLLLDPQRRVAEIYRSGRAVEILEQPSRISLSEVMPGFELSLEGIF
ncbi:MAG: Uma2 family endonuclease [Leptolyngbyaceae cyanobacterium SM1_1_3]|nr:Uma2 family endonuclease [Leptolyngbyaceae cyanobacterium SM1_1_3]NJN04780.1 Uma2 family endonuclease [Leptolyngbyaceae cyanobacterium RM1_1_2]